MGAHLNRPTDEASAAAPDAPQQRRDARDRLLLGAGALFACLAIGGSMVALNRDVPFLDVHIERASIQQSPTTSTASPATTSTTAVAVTTTTTSTVVVSTTEAPTTTAAEATIIPPSMEASAEPPPTTEAPEPITANTVPASDLEEDPTEVTIVYQAPPITEAPPVVAPQPTDVPQPTPTTASPGPATTTPAPSTTVPAGPQLLLSLPCAPNAGGVTFTITTRTDGTVRRVRLSNLPNACTDVKVRITLKNAAGAELGSDAAKVRSGHWVETSYSGFQASTVAQIMATPDN